MSRHEIGLACDAGIDFRLKTMEGREALGRVSRYDLELLCERDDVDLDDLLGTGMTVSLEGSKGAKRHLHGLVAHAAYTGTRGSFGRYKATLVPWLWFLGRRHDCRIFQNQTVPEILRAVFDSWPIAEVEDKLEESYARRDYCVQYRESDLAFASRLMEDEGITFYFKHRDGGHALVLCDAAGAHPPVTAYAEIPYFPPEDHGRRERDHVFAWRALARVRAGKATLRDFDFEKPKADLTSVLDDPHQHAQASAEVYDYPGGYFDLPPGDQRARLRLEELQSDHRRCRGEATAVGLACGHRFTLERFPRKDQNRAWLVTDAHYVLENPAWRSGAEPEGEVFRCRFEVLDIKVPFRPERRTRRPFVHGPQTATVTGPPGEEIHTDRYGRVKVQFHWDRLGKNDEHSSCWVRVSQLWAGSGWGGIHIPRIGQEVIVDFLEGDPDRPLITGRVYNAMNMPPYGLPANATQSGIKSNSSKGGGGFNELMFEDRKGSELVFLHAQKDETIVVLNDKSETVGHDETIAIVNNRTETVGVNETLSVGVDRTRKVGANESVMIGANRVDTVVMNEARTVGVAQQQTVGGARNVSVGAVQAHEIGINDTWAIGVNRSASVGNDDSLDVGSDRSAKIGSGDTLDVGKDRTVKIGAGLATTVGKSEQRQVGDGRTTSIAKDDSLTVENNLRITAGDSIEIKTGDATIVMKKNGDITIKGNNLLIDMSGKIDIKASGKITQKAQKILQN